MNNIKIKMLSTASANATWWECFTVHLHFIPFIWNVSMKANFLTDKLIKPMFFHTWNTSSKHAYINRDRQTDNQTDRDRERERENMMHFITYYNIALSLN